MKIIALSIVLMLAGCAGSAVLVRDGQAFPVSYNKATRVMSVTMDGEEYSGGVVRNTSFGIASSFSGGRTATGTAVGGNNQARATLLSPTNKVLRCDLNLTMSSAQGLCQDAQGKVYDVVAR